MRPSLSILVLTRNERLHIERCLSSAKRLSDDIHVVDSRSIDDTATIARQEGAIVHLGDFASFSQKLNWAIDRIDFRSDWILRLDADEILSERLLQELPAFLARQPQTVTGIYVRRRLWFMGRPMRFGGLYPRHSMRLWRPNMAICETRELDEHMLLRGGEAVTIEADIDDIPLIDLSQWIAKHNEYSSQEARMVSHARTHDQDDRIKPRLLGTKNERIRWIKEKVFYRVPLFVRPLLYYLHRYFLMLGFLDGKAGLVFHFLHGFWYRFLIDAKIMEIDEQVRKTRT